MTDVKVKENAKGMVRRIVREGGNPFRGMGVGQTKALARAARGARELALFEGLGGVFTPTVSQLRYDVVLGNISLGRDQGNLIGDQVASIVPVGARHGKFIRWALDNFRIHETLRVPRTRANEIAPGAFEWVPYATEQHALIESVADEEREEAGNVPGAQFDLNRDAVVGATDSLALEREKRISGLVRTPGNLGFDLTLAGTSKWSDYVNSDPFLQVRNMRQSIRRLTGFLPTGAIFPFDVTDVLASHPKIFARMNTAADKIIDEELLKKLFRLNEVLIPGGIENVSNPGQADDLRDVWGNDVILFYRNPSPGRRSLSLIYTFRLRSGATPEQVTQAAEGVPGPVRRWREGDRRTDFFEVSYEEDTKIIAPGAGAILRDVI